RYRQGVLRPAGEPADQLTRVAGQTLTVYRSAMERFALHEAAASVFQLVDATNEFIAAREPWALAKDPSAAGRLSQVLFDAAEAIRIAAVLLAPVMPSSSAEILRRVGGAGDAPRLDPDGAWRNEGERRLAQAGPLWPRKETTVTDNPMPPDLPSPGARSDTDVVPAGAAQKPPVQAPQPSVAAPPQAPATPADRISIDEFMKVELRVAKVLAAERVPKSQKLLKLRVDVGSEQRTIVGGIAEAYEPDAMVGRTVVIVFN